MVRAGHHARRILPQPRLQRGLERIDRCALKDPRDKAPQFRQRHRDQARHIVCRIGPAMHRRLAMQAADRVRQIPHHRFGQPPITGHAVEQQRVVEATHDDHPVAHRPVATQHQPRRGFRDRDGIQVDIRRAALVQLQLGFAGGTPPFEGGEIHIVEAHGAFQLVGLVSREKDNGAMRVDAPHGRAAMRRGIFQKGDDAGLRLVRHAASQRSAAFR